MWQSNELGNNIGISAAKSPAVFQNPMGNGSRPYNTVTRSSGFVNCGTNYTTRNNNNASTPLNYASSTNFHANFPIEKMSAPEQNSTFTPDQVACICESLIQSGDINRLAKFLMSLPPSELLRGNQSFLRGHAVVAFKTRNFQKLYNILQNNSFHKKYHNELQEMWFEAHYMEAENIEGRPLDAVDKFRLRLQFPVPNTIRDGKETSLCLSKEECTTFLKDYFEQNMYPTSAEKTRLATKTGMTVQQVSTWFNNRRQKYRREERRRRESYSGHRSTPYIPHGGTYARSSVASTLSDSCLDTYHDTPYLCHGGFQAAHSSAVSTNSNSHSSDSHHVNRYLNHSGIESTGMASSSTSMHFSNYGHHKNPYLNHGDLQEVEVITSVSKETSLSGYCFGKKFDLTVVETMKQRSVRIVKMSCLTSGLE